MLPHLQRIVGYLSGLIERGRAARPMATHSLVADARQTADPENIVMYLGDRAGYVREAAALRAGECLLPQTLPALIRRVNDWVPQVRDAAMSSVAQFVLADRVADFVAALPEIVRLRTGSRADHTVFLATLEQWMGEHPKRPKLSDLAFEDDPRVARAYFALELRRPSPDLAAVIDAGLQNPDRVIRWIACDLIQKIDRSDKAAYALRLLGMRQRWLKYHGLKYLAEVDAGAAQRVAERCLLDPYIPLRELSERVSGFGPEKLAGIARDALRDDAMRLAHRSVAAMLCGRRKYAGCEAGLLDLLQHEHANLRGAALLSLHRLSPERYETAVRRALLAGEVATFRAAMTAAEDGLLTLRARDWQAIVSAAPTRGAVSRLPRLARKYGKWAWLGVSLELAAQATYGHIGMTGIQGWLRAANRSFRTPTAEERAWVGGLLERANLKPHLRGELRLHASG